MATFKSVAAVFVTLALATACVSRPTATTAVGAASLAPASRFAVASHGMVVSASGIASEVGRNVLAAGGNAVDAAVATGFALAVTYPLAGNIGGGGFMVIRFPDGRATTIDFREAAPQRATPDMFVDSTGNYSYHIHHETYKAVGVPGTVAGFALAHQKYGRTPRPSAVEPAVALASEGFIVPTGLAGSLAGELNDFKQNPAALD